MKYIYYYCNQGLNDTLCSLYHDLVYSKKFNRILLIDMVYANYYVYNFDDVFKFINNYNIICDQNEIKKIINNKDLSFRQEHCLNLSKEYEEDIIKHCGCGGNDNSHKLLRELKLTDYFINDIINKYNSIPKPYTSIHIRNTDHKCDYKLIYEEYKEKLNNQNIFLATDSIDVLNYFKSLNLNIFYFTKLPDKNIPYHKAKIDNTEKLLNTISDLFLLGLADNFIYAKKSPGYYKNIANFLHINRDTLNNILDNKLLENLYKNLEDNKQEDNKLSENPFKNQEESKQEDHTYINLKYHIVNKRRI